MGMRYRRSINLGGGFRINLSKSGIGYSWGVKGYRITKTAKGSIRRTTTIPGTGISYTKEIGRKNKKAPRSNNQSSSPQINNYYDTQNIQNTVTRQMVTGGLEELLSSASWMLKIRKIVWVCLWITLILATVYHFCLLFSVILAGLLIYVQCKGKIYLEYVIERDQQNVVSRRMQPIIGALRCKRIWRITQTNKAINKKYNSGADQAVRRNICKVSSKPSFPFASNVQVATFKSGNETLLFMPDKLFVIQGTKVGVVDYAQMTMNFQQARYVESESVPRDTQIVGETWKYVNKSGGPDRRFSNNVRYPICLYGQLELISQTGLHTILVFSDPNAYQAITNVI